MPEFHSAGTERRGFKPGKVQPGLDTVSSRFTYSSGVALQLGSLLESKKHTRADVRVSCGGGAGFVGAPCAFSFKVLVRHGRFVEIMWYHSVLFAHHG